MERKCAVNKLSSAKESLLVKEQKISQMEADLKIEKEWRQRLQTTSEADKEALSKQKVEMTHLQTIANVNRISLRPKKTMWGSPNESNNDRYVVKLAFMKGLEIGSGIFDP